MARDKELYIVKQMVTELARELAKKGVIEEGWPDTMEIMFDKRTRESLERSFEDVKEGRFLTWDEVFGKAKTKARPREAVQKGDESGPNGRE
jgi:hypothetical protein